jgi:hypothetical protein
MKKNWVATTLSVFGICWVSLMPFSVSARPNILLITADDIRWDSGGAQ